MKITSKSNITSIKLTTLMSAFNSKRSRRRRRDISNHSLPHEQRNEHAAEALHLPIEPIETAREDVVAERRRNRDCERRSRCRQRFADARRHSGKIPRSLGRNAQERFDDAEYCTQETDEWTDRADRCEPRKKSTDAITLFTGLRVEQQMQRLDLRATERRRRWRVRRDWR